ncbi:bifunctional epoxide hydrolase 2-like isoform X4 [Micropterus salmoides]|nr:bifunctional epoxide hydrolase 2-like isoform X3 [Micropterus salmoides]XP_038560765.1 bifunctional epoxide hydrolase 2-like isoform X3 [Micropterus salmoides]XP_038572998.1 bifunctional epoxide hydrolase 2-like isoform X4 [Micropterus salmoides]XP_038573044.1 bifunctional epoxide hydrolase 2-like isoform X4 [Micropterus salmoides]XP_038573489.1 bifunctional epoxide hydrolase 2-like isoform X4 [Micropterus salmoides]
MIAAFEAECVKEAQVRGVTLPSDWSVRGLLEELREAMMDVQPAVLKAAAGLRHRGLLTAVLANHWLDDSAAGDGPARLLSLLGGHFDQVLQSCRSGHRVPESSAFSSALRHLGVTSQQALWLDADEEGVKAAEGAGMKAVLVENLADALDKLADFTGVQAAGAESPPPSCSPDEVSHGYVTIGPGVRTHYVEMGSGPPVLLCHGFPESWYSWRYQIPAVAAAGFRVLALDMKGYGESTAPPDTEEYSQEQLCQDLITFLDKMAIPQVTLVGHDWGGVLVWTMAQYHPERVSAAASLNTPLFPADPSVTPAERLKAEPRFDYQLYFQKPGAAEAELEKDLERTFKIFFFSSGEAAKRPAVSTAGVCARGGLFVGLPEQIPRSSVLTEADLQYYVSQYRERGFRWLKTGHGICSQAANIFIQSRSPSCVWFHRRPLNWYRNGEANWRWMCSRPTAKLLMPALMVTAGKDQVLLPAFSKGMEDLIPNLSRGHIEECGHWTQMERPAETNSILISWLRETHKKAGGVKVAPKL